MDYYVGGIGISLFTRELEEAQKLSLDLEEKAVKGICSEIIKHYKWEEFNAKKETGVALSIIGLLYGPEEYKALNIADLHYQIGMGLINGKTEGLPQPALPAPVRRVSGGIEVHLRVIPIFLYGNEKEARRIFKKELPVGPISEIVAANLTIDLTKSELFVYRTPIDFDRVIEWKNNTIKQLLNMFKR